MLPFRLSQYYSIVFWERGYLDLVALEGGLDLKQVAQGAAVGVQVIVLSLLRELLLQILVALEEPRRQLHHRALT